MKTNKLFTSLFIILTICFASCNNGSKKGEKQAVQDEQQSNSQQLGSSDQQGQLADGVIHYGDEKNYLTAYYQLPHIKEFYEWQELTFDSLESMSYPDDLSTISYEELRLLKSEILARNGYLFDDGYLRGYFNQYKWYMPIFDADDFKVILNEEEKALTARIEQEMQNRKQTATVKRENLQLLNSELVANSRQFVKVHQPVLDDLNQQNFSIVDANRSMPFYTYDENAYQHIPHYITTDLYLFILHKYFSSFIERLEENYLNEQLKKIFKGTQEQLSGLSATSHQAAIDWAKMYNATALYALGDKQTTAPASYKGIFETEKKSISAQNGNPSFIPNDFVDYQELKPRGHYTKSDQLKQYFNGFKWVALNGIDLDDDEQLKGLLVLAFTIQQEPKLEQQYREYMAVIEKMAGQEDNLSLSDVMQFTTAGTIEELLAPSAIKNIRTKLRGLEKEKIKAVFGESFETEERDKKRVFFISSTYSISGDIFSKLIHIDLENSKRPFPRGLDVPAVFGNPTAQKIITAEYKDQQKWPEYLPELKKLQSQFKSFDQWDHNYGFKGVQTALAANAEQDNYPSYMKTDAYNRKELSTTLSSWTHIKHDLILYQEKPFAAEAGQGGGPAPPKHYSYVEPNLKFWDTALELVDWLMQLTKYESDFKYELERIKDLGTQLKTVAYKQVEGKKITDEEYSDLHYVGGTVEYILLALLGTDHLPERSRSMALIADVYVYNGQNLNVAVGHADDIYVLVPINGEYYITKGAVFSYYEFQGPIFSDEEWQAIDESTKKQYRPEWMKPLIKNGPPLKGRMQFRYEGHGGY